MVLIKYYILLTDKNFGGIDKQKIKMCALYHKDRIKILPRIMLSFFYT